MLFHARSMFGVPLGLLLGQGFRLGIPWLGVPIGVAPGQGSHWGSQGIGVPIGVAPGQGLGDPWPFGTPQRILALWDPPRPPP